MCVPRRRNQQERERETVRPLSAASPHLSLSLADFSLIRFPFPSTPFLHAHRQQCMCVCTYGPFLFLVPLFELGNPLGVVVVAERRHGRERSHTQREREKRKEKREREKRKERREREEKREKREEKRGKRKQGNTYEKKKSKAKQSKASSPANERTTATHDGNSHARHEAFASCSTNSFIRGMSVICSTRSATSLARCLEFGKDTVTSCRCWRNTSATISCSSGLSSIISAS